MSRCDQTCLVLMHYHRLIEEQFGQGCTACPAAGMVGPELVAGRIHEHIQAACRDLEPVLLALPALPRSKEMTREDLFFVARLPP